MMPPYPLVTAAAAPKDEVEEALAFFFSSWF
jgi:hypothetical protein